MSNNLASYFANQNTTTQNNNNKSSMNPNYINPNGDDEDMGPSISMAVEAKNDEDFHNSTFKLKRTRSMGLLDPKNNHNNKENNIQQPVPSQQQQLLTPNVVDYDDYSDDSTTSSTDSSSSSSNDDQVYDQDEDIDMKSYTPSASVSPPPPDNDKLLPQDDNDVVREPQRHVDYLSHHWKESEISNSWKYIIAKKKKRDIDVVNTARLENASWRTWAKARNNLKTVSPEILNWSKDSDVTWLYGPIVRGGNKKKKLTHKDDYTYDNNDDDDDDDDDEMDETDHQQTDDYERGYGSDGDETTIRLPSTSPSTSSHSKTSITKHHNPSKKTITPKPILKRRTMTEIIEENAQWKLNEARKHFNEVKNAQSIMDPDNQTSVHDDYDLLAAKVNAQYFNYPPSSSTTSTSSNQQNQQLYSPNENNNNNNNNNDNEQSNITNNDQNKSKDNNNINNNNNDGLPSHETDTFDRRYSDTAATNTTSDNSGNTADSNFANSNGGLTTSTSVPVLNSYHRNIYTISTSHDGGDTKNGTLSSILTTPSHIRLRNSQNKNSDGVTDTKKQNKDRHIHFNDRVEQCMALKYANGTPSTTTDDNDIDMDGDFYSSDDDDYNEEFSDYTGSESDSNSNEGENDDEHGLFISARFARRSDSLVHSPITDTSSIGSSSMNGRQHPHIRPIIKMLPATTLNYGSDEESDGSDFNGGYGNAVSHNVNTQRGYDYIYDYNSVYTGDTSSFLPMDSCDIIDVPEGIDLQTAMADEKPQDYNMLSPQNSVPNRPPQIPISPVNGNDHIYSSDDDQYSMSSNTDDDQFIEDSHYQGSYDDESESDSGDNENYLQTESKPTNNNLGLKRTMSIGRSNNSLVQLSHQGSSSTSLKNGFSHSFINGEPLNNSSLIGNAPQHRTNPPSKRNTSKSFVFDSESEDDSDSDSMNNEKENMTTKLQSGDLNLDSLQTKPGPRRKLGPPQRSSSSLLLDNLRRTSSSDLSKSIKIPNNASAAADIVPSDVAIEGSFSPRNDSLKSVISKEKLINHHNYKSTE